MKATNLLLGIGLCALLIQNAAAQIAEKRIFFPYFRAVDLPELAMPLAHKESQVSVHIDGLRARISVRQRYKNETQHAIRLTCVVPTDLDSLAGRAQGKNLLKKPNLPAHAYTEAKQPLFMPDVEKDTEIELVWYYHTLCEKEGEISTFRFPAFQANAPVEEANVHYNLKISFHTEHPLQDITSPKHMVEVHYPTSNTAEVVFTPEERQAGSRPLVLQYKFYGSQAIQPDPAEGVMRGGDDYQVTQGGKTDDKVAKELFKIAREYEAKQNDYLEKIADKYGIAIEDIIKDNHLKPNAALYKGQKLKLLVPCQRIEHIIAEDEYPYQLAQLYGVSTSDILEWNHLKNTDKLSIGQKIYIYYPAKH